MEERMDHRAQRIGSSTVQDLVQLPDKEFDWKLVEEKDRRREDRPRLPLAFSFLLHRQTGTQRKRVDRLSDEIGQASPVHEVVEIALPPRQRNTSPVGACRRRKTPSHTQRNARWGRKRSMFRLLSVEEETEGKLCVHMHV